MGGHPLAVRELINNVGGIFHGENIGGFFGESQRFFLIFFALGLAGFRLTLTPPQAGQLPFDVTLEADVPLGGEPREERLLVRVDADAIHS